MEIQTQTIKSLDIRNLVRKINSCESNLNVKNSPKVIFPYVEMYCSQNYSPKPRIVTREMSKHFFSLDSKSKRKEAAHFHAATFKYKKAFFNAETGISVKIHTNSASESSNIPSKLYKALSISCTTKSDPHPVQNDLRVPYRIKYPDQIKSIRKRNLNCDLNLRKFQLPSLCEVLEN